MQHAHHRDAILACAVEDQVMSRCKIAQALAKVWPRRTDQRIASQQIQCPLDPVKDPVRGTLS
jgi:hypothetical protein